MILKFRVSEQTISALNTKSVPRIGSKDYLVFQFSFSNDWDGLTKTAYLQRDSVSVPIEIKDGLVEVPEWFTEQESFNVTIFGTDGTKEVPTNVVAVKLEKSNDLWVKDAPEPTPSWITELIDLSNHPPIPGSNGFWLLWDVDRNEYIESKLPLPEATTGGTSDHSKLTNRDAGRPHPGSTEHGVRLWDVLLRPGGRQGVSLLPHRRGRRRDCDPALYAPRTGGTVLLRGLTA